jgi:hypothetical protein
VSDVAAFDPERIITVLAERGVRYILIGALAARLQGFPRLTADADITPARDADNLSRLAAALRDLDGRIYTDGVPEGLPFDWDGAALARADIWNLATHAGRLDVVFSPTPDIGYDALRTNAIEFDVFGATLLVAELSDIVRLKEAADRPQDRQDVAVMREMLRRRPLDQAPGP